MNTGETLPAFKFPSGDGNPIAYVDAVSGEFQRIRHAQWRWFDFLMTHTMDYQGRDNFNTLLRGFSLLGLITVLSGFALAFVTSAWLRRKNLIFCRLFWSINTIKIPISPKKKASKNPSIWRRPFFSDIKAPIPPVTTPKAKYKYIHRLK